MTEQNDKERCEMSESKCKYCGEEIDIALDDWDNLSADDHGEWYHASCEMADLRNQLAAAKAEIERLNQCLSAAQKSTDAFANGMDDWQTRALEAQTENATLRAKVEELKGLLGLFLPTFMPATLRDDQFWGYQIEVKVSTLKEAAAALAAKGGGK
jgi:DNA repair exonuclease SbcCD ATPase subunit